MTAVLDPTEPKLRLAKELDRQLATKRDLIADTRRLQLVGTLAEDNESAVIRTALAFDGEEGVEEVPIRPHAAQQIATHLKVPWKLYDRLDHDHPDLLTNLVNGLLHREPTKRMVRLLDGQMRAFVSDRYRRLDNFDLMANVVLPVLDEHPDMSIVSWSLSETRLYIKTTLPRELEVRVGDPVRAGVIVSNSEVGAGSVVVAPYTEVLACMNGAVHMEYGKRRHHVGRRIDVDDEAAYELYSDLTMQLDDAAFWSKCADLMRAAANEVVFESIINDMRELAGIPIPAAPVEAIKVLAQKHNLTQGEEEMSLTNLIAGGDRTAWGYFNAITATAKATSDPDRRFDLERLAGTTLMVPEEWAALAA